MCATVSPKPARQTQVTLNAGERKGGIRTAQESSQNIFFYTGPSVTVHQPVMSLKAITSTINKRHHHQSEFSL